MLQMLQIGGSVVTLRFGGLLHGELELSSEGHKGYGRVCPGMTVVFIG